MHGYEVMNFLNEVIKDLAKSILFLFLQLSFWLSLIVWAFSMISSMIFIIGAGMSDIANPEITLLYRCFAIIISIAFGVVMHYSCAYWMIFIEFLNERYSLGIDT